jgi:hypothetical protein
MRGDTFNEDESDGVTEQLVCVLDIDPIAFQPTGLEVRFWQREVTLEDGTVRMVSLRVVQDPPTSVDAKRVAANLPTLDPW